MTPPSSSSQDMMDRRTLVSLYDFENRKAIFPASIAAIKFCLLTLAGASRQYARAEFVFFALQCESTCATTSAASR